MAKLSTLDQFLENGNLNGNFLTLTVIKKITSEKYIVGDTSCLGLLELQKNGKEIKIGQGIKLIKPVRVNEFTLQCNPKFSPVKTLEHDKISPSIAEIQEIESKAEISTKNTENEYSYVTFEEIRKMAPGTFLQTVTFLVTNVSRVIQTKSGHYQICGLKDINSDKISINLYDNFMNKLEVGNVFTANKIKKFHLKKEGEYETRLQTSKFTTLSKATKKDNDAFKNVKLADHSVDGTILGFTNLSCYFSCSKHWTKLDDDEMCQVCGGKPEESKFDFKAELLIENNETEDNVQNFLMFKRAAVMITTESDEESVENTLAEYEGRKCTVEHNTSDGKDALVIVKRLITYM